MADRGGSRAQRPDWTLVWPLVIVASALGAVAIAVVEPGPPVQPMLAFWFLLVCPGMAFARLLHLPSAALEWTIAISVSIALGVGVAEVLLYTGYWSPVTGVGVLAELSLVGVGFQLRERA